MKLMLCVLFNYVMGDKIRSLNMNVAFKYIWPKGMNCLIHGRIVYLCIMYQSLHDYDYQLPEKGCAFLAHLVKTEIKEVVLGTSLKNKYVELIRLDQVHCNSNIFCFLFMCLPESMCSTQF